MIYVFGKNGYIGKTLLEYFYVWGMPAIGIGRDDEIKPYHNAFTNKDTIINAACSGWGKSAGANAKDVIDSNLILPVKINELRDSGSVMIQLSSAIELVDPNEKYVKANSLYARTKRLATEYLQNDAHIIYLYTIFGGKYGQQNKLVDSLLRACAQNKPYTIMTPNHTRDFVRISRLFQIILTLIGDTNWKTIQLGYGKKITFYNILEAIEKAAGKRFEDVYVDWSDKSDFKYYADNPHFDDINDLYEDIKAEWSIINDKTVM